jgi:hypothetical protein
MRQEIFIAEGRRVTDLGIKLQVADFEAISNSNVLPEHQEPQIPAYIKSMDLTQFPLDNFTNDAVNKKVIIDHDFTKLIVSNRETNEVAPFY